MQRQSSLFVSFFSFFLVFIFYSCQSQEKLDSPVPYQTLPEFICAYGYIPFDSIDIQTFEDGTYFSITFFNDGQPHGQQLFFHENGEIKTRKYYCMGEVNGPIFNYFEDGTLQAKGYFYQGRMNGSWYFYYPDGNLKEVIYFIENQERGPFREYHENGNLKASGYYISEDMEHGLLYLYEVNGALKRRMRCNNGICLTISS